MRTRTRLASFLIGILLAGCASLPPAKPATDFQAIAGTWVGTIYGRFGVAESTFTIKGDGSWENLVPRFTSPGPRFVGTARVADGKYRWKSETSGMTGTWTLHEGNGKKVLAIQTDDGGTTGQYEPKLQ